MQADPEVAVEVCGLIKDFRVGFAMRRRRVLDGVSFRVRRGEIFGFLGPNGAGKTTTLKVLLGLIRADGGEARVLGQPVGDPACHRHVGFLPESPYFYDFLTGRELLQLYARLSGVAREAQSERVEKLLGWVGLRHAADLRLRAYSKGMLQRIGIAQALVHDPEVVFLDEPMSGLDPLGRKEIRDLILRLNAEGKTVFMNTHILSDAEMLCHRVAIIVRGRVHFEGAIEEFLGAGERSTDLVLAGLPPALAERLEERFGARLRGVGDCVEVQVAEKRVEEVVRAVLDAGARIVSLHPHRVSLEEIFLSAVQEGGR